MPSVRGRERDVPREAEHVRRPGEFSAHLLARDSTVVPRVAWVAGALAPGLATRQKTRIHPEGRGSHLHLPFFVETSK